MMLVASFVGDTESADRIGSIYSTALKNDFRFLSYGDASFLVRPKSVEAPSIESQSQPQMASTSNATADADGGGVEQRVLSLSGLPPALVRGDVNGHRVLLHSCCAPCSGAMVEEMRDRGLDITIYFYNPNVSHLQYPQQKKSFSSYSHFLVSCPSVRGRRRALTLICYRAAAA